MKKHIFLMGDIGTGKSTIIKKALAPCIKDVAGYYVQRVYCDKDLKGFQMCSPTDGHYNLDSHLSNIHSMSNFFY